MPFQAGLDFVEKPGLDLWLRRVILMLGLPLLFLPKVNIIEVAGESAGLRIDDIVLFALIPLVALAMAVRRRPAVSRAECAFVVMLTLFMVSSVVNFVVFGRSNPLYAVRFAEYFLFYYIGVYCGAGLTYICYSLLGVNAIFMVLQACSLIGGFASEGYVPSAANRPFGLTGGPWEIGAVINIVFAALLYDGRRKYWLLFIATFALLLLCGARSPAVIHLIVFGVFLFRRSKHKGALLIRGGTVLAVGLIAFLAIPNKVTERSQYLFNPDNLVLAQKIYERTELDPHFTSFEKVDNGAGILDSESDTSWLLRATKWMYACKTWATTPVAWVIGLGPGMWGPSLDGGWLRLLTETGALGLLAFVLFFNTLSSTPLLKAVRLCVYLNMAFIDIYISYKTMSLVFLIAGATVGTARFARAQETASELPRLGAATPG